MGANTSTETARDARPTPPIQQTRVPSTNSRTRPHKPYDSRSITQFPRIFPLDVMRRIAWMLAEDEVRYPASCARKNNLLSLQRSCWMGWEVATPFLYHRIAFFSNSYRPGIPIARRSPFGILGEELLRQQRDNDVDPPITPRIKRILIALKYTRHVHLCLDRDSHIANHVRSWAHLVTALRDQAALQYPDELRYPDEVKRGLLLPNLESIKLEAVRGEYQETMMDKEAGWIVPWCDPTAICLGPDVENPVPFLELATKDSAWTRVRQLHLSTDLDITHLVEYIPRWSDLDMTITDTCNSINAMIKNGHYTQMIYLDMDDEAIAGHQSLRTIGMLLFRFSQHHTIHPCPRITIRSHGGLSCQGVPVSCLSDLMLNQAWLDRYNAPPLPERPPDPTCDYGCDPPSPTQHISLLRAAFLQATTYRSDWTLDELEEMMTFWKRHFRVYTCCGGRGTSRYGYEVLDCAHCRDFMRKGPGWYTS